MEPTRDVEAELRVLRERIAQLENATSARTDPLLGALLENSSSFLMVVTPDGRFIATGRESPAYGSVVGRSILEFIEPSSRPVALAALERVRTTRQAVSYETEGYGEEGEPGHVYQVRAVPLMTGDEVTAVVVVPTDVTARVHMERSLRENAEALRLAADATGIGFWHWDIEKNLLTWDARMLELFGVEQTPADYLSYQALIHPEDLRIVRDAVTHALERGTYPTNEHRIIRPSDGTERWVLGSARVTCNEDGRPVRLQGGALDITQRKQLARHLEQAERVQAVGQLAAGIAHNFNNLLAVILPNLAMAVDDPTEQDAEGLRAALTAAEQARQLVASMLALSVGDANTQGATNVTEVVTRTVQMCRATFPRQIDIVVRSAQLPGCVHLASSGLEQVLLNLLTNARDALACVSERQLRIDVSVQHVPPPQNEFGTPGLGSARLTVGDNGIGMSEEVRRRIFDPFFTTKPPQRGSGLGLATVAARVRDAGGTVECSSKPGMGTMFEVLLPLEPGTSDAPRVLPPRGRPSLRGRVLLVDDEVLVRSTVRRVLESAGLTVEEASNTSEARAVLDRGTVDLVLLDHSMPVESGVAALPSLRARTRAPIVLFTGHMPQLPAGVTRVLHKPASAEELLSAVAQEMEARC